MIQIPALEELNKAFNSLAEENRQLRAKLNNTKKLSGPEVKRIRTLYSTKNFSQAELADAFDVNPATVSRIVRGIYH